VLASGPSAIISNSVATASSAGTAGVITLTAANTFAVGQIANVQGLTNGAAVNGDNLVVISTGLDTTKFESNMVTAAITTGSDVGTAQLWITGNPTSTAGQVGAEVTSGTNLSGESVTIALIGG
jgi:hypothetical protein